MAMTFEEAKREVKSMRETPFRERFKSFVGGEIQALDDDAITLAFTAAKEKYSALDIISAILPIEGREHFEKLRKMRTSRSGAFFERFAMFTKLVDDGMLIGIGKDDLYYVVATWDRNGADLWEPTTNVFDEPVMM